MPGNTLGLSSGVNANGTRPTECLNCTQMTNDRMDDVLYRMERVCDRVGKGSFTLSLSQNRA